MTTISEAELHDVTGGNKTSSQMTPLYDKKGWFEQVKVKNGEVFRRDVSPSGRPSKWQPVDTFWVLPTS